MTSFEHPFDLLAPSYDATFTSRRLGRWLRGAVWEQAAELFTPGMHVLELGCGTGEDAVWLARRGVQVLATDAAPAMLESARRKAAAAGLVDRIAFARMDLAQLSAGCAVQPGRLERQGEVPRFDGALSNFGAMNCVPDRRRVAAALARQIRSGGLVLLVLMGPLCAWELGWHLLHGEVRTALRRLRAGAAAHLGDGATVQVWYPSPRRLREEFAEFFLHRATVAIGALLPPSHLADLVDRWPSVFGTLALLDRRLSSLAPTSWLSDHYLMILERK